MITINVTKARVIAHDMRRAARAAEFAPHDAAIAKRIPGTAEAEAEAARAAIREKYAAMQAEIEAASTPDAIKAALGAG
ncbi:hypothetical protein UFOVP730_20 [uncultured Caudovirales phage]|uniref:Uncharacterized protein n=1 Tax=uncultured Caudovirales phage TaxID=2100421 RepID=A0A6J5NTH3_9CAUD|nr:hypothetical protein UFOVP730_20 [uncultured Caudovirales phage]